MEYIYKTSGVCSSEIRFEIEGDYVKSLQIKNGCPGNALGIGALSAGMKIDDLIERLKGIRCGRRATSCPDQLARALEQYKIEQGALAAKAE